MEVLALLVPLALLLVTASLLAFRWAVGDGQFDDLVSPAVRMLDDDVDDANDDSSPE